MNKKPDDIENLINQLEDDARQEDIQELLEDEEHRSYVRLMRETNEVFARESSSAPDAKVAWEQFKRKKIKSNSRTKYFFIGGMAAAVACLALFLLFRNTGQEAVLPETIQTSGNSANVQGGVVITTGSGEQQIIGTRQSDSLLLAKGIEVNDKSLNYRNIAKEEQQTLRIPRGQDFKIILSDGTEVWLNAESQLTYSSIFSGAERVVELVGEAYFKVTKDEKRPFIIHTNMLSTRVIGTEFNMKAYQNDMPHVTLITGKVQVRKKGQAKEIELLPGEDVSVGSEGELVVQSVDTYPYVQWKNGYFYFDNVPLKDVIHALERWYNVEFEMKDAAILSQRVHYTANRREGIAKAIENLNALNQVNATMENNKVIIGNR